MHRSRAASAPPRESTGRRVGEEAREAGASDAGGHDRREAVLEVLARQGYRPELGDDGEIALANCPFHRLAAQHRTLVCGMNLDFLRGLLDGLGQADQLVARLAPEPGTCCVRMATT